MMFYILAANKSATTGGTSAVTTQSVKHVRRRPKLYFYILRVARDENEQNASTAVRDYML